METNEKISGCKEFWGKDRAMNWWSTGDFQSSQTILYDTLYMYMYRSGAIHVILHFSKTTGWTPPRMNPHANYVCIGGD